MKLSQVLTEILNRRIYRAWTGRSSINSEYMCYCIDRFDKKQKLGLNIEGYTSKIVEKLRSDNESKPNRKYHFKIASLSGLFESHGYNRFDMQPDTADAELRKRALKYWRDFIKELEAKGE